MRNSRTNIWYLRNPKTNIWAQINENGGWRLLHNEKCYCFYRPAIINREIKSRVVRTETNIAIVGETKNIFKVLTHKSIEKKCI